VGGTRGRAFEDAKRLTKKREPRKNRIIVRESTFSEGLQGGLRWEEGFPKEISPKRGGVMKKGQSWDSFVKRALSSCSEKKKSLAGDEGRAQKGGGL